MGVFLDLCGIWLHGYTMCCNFPILVCSGVPAADYYLVACVDPASCGVETVQGRGFTAYMYYDSHHVIVGKHNCLEMLSSPPLIYC